MATWSTAALSAAERQKIREMLDWFGKNRVALDRLLKPPTTGALVNEANEHLTDESGAPIMPEA